MAGGFARAGDAEVMTDAQRMTLMADWWPKACRAQGWKEKDRALRLRVLGEAVKRRIDSATELDTREDIDAVKAHLGYLADNVKSTRETIYPEEGRARRLRVTIQGQLKCLGLYHPDPAGYLAEIIKDKFKRGSRAEPLTLEDLTASPRHFTDRAGKIREIPSALDQVMMTLGRAIQAKRSAAGHTVHDMLTGAGLACTCRICSPRPPVRVEMPATPEEVFQERKPF